MPCTCTATSRSAAAALSALGYLAGSVGYVAMPVIVVLSRRAQTARRSPTWLWPADDDRRLAAAAFWAPLLLPAVAAPGERHRDHLAVVDVGLDAAAGAAAVAAAVTLRDIDTRRILPPRSSSRSPC